MTRWETQHDLVRVVKGDTAILQEAHAHPCAHVLDLLGVVVANLLAHDVSLEQFVAEEATIHVQRER